MNIYDLKIKINNDLDIIINNRDFLKITITDSDIDKVKNVIKGKDLELLKQCSNEADDIINGIIISIDEELNRLLKINNNDIETRKNILNKLIDINNRLIYFPDNKSYFLSKIKKIYLNIDGDNL